MFGFSLGMLFLILYLLLVGLADIGVKVLAPIYALIPWLALAAAVLLALGK